MYSALVCENFPRTIEVYVGNYPSSIVRVKYSRKIVLKCNFTAFAYQDDTYGDAKCESFPSIGEGLAQSLAALGSLDGVARHHLAVFD
jgi:hypothetical protein